MVGGRWSAVVLVGGRFFTAIGRWSVVFQIGGRWFLWSVVGYFLGKWSVVGDAWSVVGVTVVGGRWSVVGGQWSVVSGLWSMAGRWAMVLYNALPLRLLTWLFQVR